MRIPLLLLKVKPVRVKQREDPEYKCASHNGPAKQIKLFRRKPHRLKHAQRRKCCCETCCLISAFEHFNVLTFKMSSAVRTEMLCLTLYQPITTFSDTQLKKLTFLDFKVDIGISFIFLGGEEAGACSYLTNITLLQNLRHSRR